MSDKKKLLEEIKSELVSIRTDITLLSFDITQIRKQLEENKLGPKETVGIVPVPPPDFYPPEIM